MEDIFWYILAGVGGTLAGMMNALAGNGSAITLYILMEGFGLPPNVANGTNRLGIVSMSSLSAFSFYKRRPFQKARAWPVLIPLFLGAMLGFWLAIHIDNKDFKEVFRYMLLLLLLVILINPKRWLRPTDEAHKMPLWIALPGFFALGVYGGFIQMGMGVLFLMLAVFVGRLSLVDANGLKLVGVAAYTFVGVLWFIQQDLIRWDYGLLLAVGQSAGGLLATRFATRHPKANVWVHRLMVATVLFALFQLFVLPML